MPNTEVPLGQLFQPVAKFEALFLFEKEVLATLGEFTIATQFAVIHSLIHIVGFFARKMR